MAGSCFVLRSADRCVLTGNTVYLHSGLVVTSSGGCHFAGRLLTVSLSSLTCLCFAFCHELGFLSLSGRGLLPAVCYFYTGLPSGLSQFLSVLEVLNFSFTSQESSAGCSVTDGKWSVEPHSLRLFHRWSRRGWQVAGKCSPSLLALRAGVTALPAPAALLSAALLAPTAVICVLLQQSDPGKMVREALSTPRLARNCIARFQELGAIFQLLTAWRPVLPSAQQMCRRCERVKGQRRAGPADAGRGG